MCCLNVIYLPSAADYIFKKLRHLHTHKHLKEKNIVTKAARSPDDTERLFFCTQPQYVKPASENGFLCGNCLVWQNHFRLFSYIKTP